MTKYFMGDIMPVSYSRLWKLLIDKKISQADFRRMADIAPNTLTKLRRDEPVSFAVLDKICQVLQIDYGEMMKYQAKERIFKEEL